MSPNVTRLSRKQEDAALLVADDQYPDEVIAATVKVSKRTLERWKQQSLFQRRVQEICTQVRQAALEQTIAAKAKRVDALSKRWQKCQQTIDERAAFYRRADEEQKNISANGAGEMDEKAEPIGEHKKLERVQHAGVPGATTGLLVHEEKVTQYGTVTVYRVDIALLDEMLKIEKQVAIELGQWMEKHTAQVNLSLQPAIQAAIDKFYSEDSQLVN